MGQLVAEGGIGGAHFGSQPVITSAKQCYPVKFVSDLRQPLRPLQGVDWIFFDRGSGGLVDSTPGYPLATLRVASEASPISAHLVPMLACPMIRGQLIHPFRAGLID